MELLTAWKQSITFLLPNSLKKVLFVVMRLLIFLLESRQGGIAFGLFIIFSALGRTFLFFYVASCIPFLIMVLIMRPSLMQKNGEYIVYFSLRLALLSLLYGMLALFQIPAECLVFGVFGALLVFDARGDVEDMGASLMRLFRLIIFDLPLLLCVASVHWFLLSLIRVTFFNGGWFYKIGEVVSFLLFLILMAFYAVVYCIRTTIDYERYFGLRGW